MSSTGWIIGFAIAVVVIVVMIVVDHARRLDRLHAKVEAARATLDAQLVRRATAIGELSSSGAVDPATSIILTDLVIQALAADRSGRDELDAVAGESTVREVEADEASHTQRAQVESELSRLLRELLGDPESVAMIMENPWGRSSLIALDDAWYRVQLARRFHNDAVAQTLRMRGTVLVRALHLAGHAARPIMFEMDDAEPQALVDAAR